MADVELVGGGSTLVVRNLAPGRGSWLMSQRRPAETERRRSFQASAEPLLLLLQAQQSVILPQVLGMSDFETYMRPRNLHREQHPRASIRSNLDAETTVLP